jgi:CheY-like chemotaxis protein
MSPPTLLLVDDAPEIGFLVKRLIRKSGQEVVICLDVPSALERLQTLQPDLILLDLNLPGPSGLELCAHLHRHSEHRQRPIALFGSAARTDDLAAALEAGVDFFFDKDLLAQPDAWRARLGEILQMASSGSAPHLISYMDSRMSLALPADGTFAFNEALRHTAVLQRGTPAVRVLLRRTLFLLWEFLPNEGNLPAGGVSAAVAESLSPDGLGLAPAAFPPAHRGRAVAACAISLSDQFARVWGRAASQAAREALIAWMPSE